MAFRAPIKEDAVKRPQLPQNAGMFDRLMSIIDDPTNAALQGSPFAAGAAIARKAPQGFQAAKDAIRDLLTRDYADKATPFAFRGTNLDELRDIAKTGRLSIGQDAEGIPGISAATISKEGFPVYGSGYGYITKGGEFTPSGRFGEVLVDPKTDPRFLQYVVNDKVYSFDQLRDVLRTKK